MIASILAFLNPMKSVISEIAKYQTIKLNSKSEIARVEANERLTYLKIRQEVLLAEQKSRLTRFIRPLFAMPFIIFNFKVVVYDKVLGLGTTDNLSEQFWQLQMIVFGAYFLTRPFEKKK